MNYCSQRVNQSQQYKHSNSRERDGKNKKHNSNNSNINKGNRFELPNFMIKGIHHNIIFRAKREKKKPKNCFEQRQEKENKYQDTPTLSPNEILKNSVEWRRIYYNTPYTYIIYIHINTG